MHDSLPRTVHPVASASPAALRPRRPSWRDPRLVFGVVLLCGSVLAGARVLDGADDTVPVLAVRNPLAAGQLIEPSELTTVRLRFGDEADADRYLPGSSDLDDAVALRPLGAGELLPRDAVGSGGVAALAELPLTLRPGRVPAAVRVGSSVDVWAAQPARESIDLARRAEAELLLEDVPVLSSGRSADAVSGGLRQVVVGVPEADEPRMARIVARLSEETLLLVRRPG
ncbi:MAG TPA: SAF domain-containing protein [Marmoricola sp.]|nr:SAF domain-containing protein [Marmoricola sp.]